MSPKRASTGARKPAKNEERPPSEVDVSELVLSSGSDTEEEDVEAFSGDSDSEADVEHEIDHAVKDYVGALTRNVGNGAGQPPTVDASEEDEGREEADEAGFVTSESETGTDGEMGEEEPASPRPQDDPASDSSEDERPGRNTVGNVPLEWYDAEEHIGYDKDGMKLVKKGRKDKLDTLLARNDSTKARLAGELGSGHFLRTVYDDYNDEEIVLSKAEMRMINRIRTGQFPHLEVNPFPEENDWFTRDTEVMPLTGAPEPKRRFVPSKWEEKKVVKLVRAIRRGWLKLGAPPAEEADKPYLMWQDDGQASSRTGTGLAYIPAPKPRLPGHAESYNPPKEYLPTEEELAAVAMQPEEERPAFVPTAFPSLRAVPAYAAFIKERFERCLDLYLCPRGRRKRAPVKDPSVLVPHLPKPRDLQPFPSAEGLRFLGHAAAVTGLAPDASGAWLASSSRDGSVRLWEARTGRCAARWDLGELQGAELGRGVAGLAWCPDPALRLLGVACGEGAVLVHQLSKGATQAPFRKTRGRPVHVLFHPTKPLFFLATQQQIRIYNLAKQAMVKKLFTGAGVITSIALHSTGDHLIVGSEDNRLAWYDLDLSTRPYRALRFHSKALRGVAFHRSYPLFASASDDGLVQVFHGMVYADLMTNPLIVPVKILHGGVPQLAVAFHPTQPWVFAGGQDGVITLYVNV
ncbi:Ribosome biogenesis protein BOP1-like protein [Auxenochlorella protothecoides]|uniref:Ribosome biogenesis protein BOP1 homolog n=1 Tax=Auxenochlorella protothecoides TaxID=3075 RepID=A0A087SA58_AUXPR|nr:Ribosome biogenesis protein BOP1-like protein [Auxenochlorella protothecoides]KFM22612.1 Ribosome biogenesis protein BOP1-like protein [Auxenochlorella protothecoides]